MKKKRDNDYFEMFVKMVEYACASSELLHETLTNFDPNTLSDKIVQMHEFEHAADMQNHDVRNRLVKEFMPPIEREDIISLVQEIDDVTDSIEDVLLRIYMFHIDTIREEALAFSEVIVTCCSALKIALENFHNFKKTSPIQENIIEINRLEEEGDKLYTDAIRNLYSNSKDPVEIIAWTQTFDRLEKCCDACEHVSNIIETIIMKNS